MERLVGRKGREAPPCAWGRFTRCSADAGWGRGVGEVLGMNTFQTGCCTSSWEPEGVLQAAQFPLHLWFRGSLLAVLQDTQLLQESMYRLAQDRTGRQLSPSSLSGKFRLEILTSGLQVHLEMKPVESPRQENLSSSETVGFKSPRGIVWWRPSSILAKQL